MTADMTPATGVPMGNDEVREALEVATLLIRSGVPVFAAEPALDDAGSWAPAGGHGGCGYWLPSGWERTVPTMNVLADPGHTWVGKTWRPGMALAAVMGHVCDGLDVDPRNGGLDGVTSLPLADGLTGLQRTPSGGYHRLIAPLRAGSRDGVAPGVDIKGGMADGKGRGFLFIAPTVRRSKETGLISSYRWEEIPDLATLPKDASGSELAAYVRGLKAPRKDPAAGGVPGVSVAPPTMHPAALTPLAGAAARRRVQEFAAKIRSWPDGSPASTPLFTIGTKVGGYVAAGQVDVDWARSTLHAALGGWTWKQAGDHDRMLREIDKGLRVGVNDPTPRPWLPQITGLTAEITGPPVLAATPTPPMSEALSDAAVTSAPGSAGTAAGTGGRRLSLTPASSIVMRRVRWTWDSRWAIGSLALVAGKQGLGKSTVVYERGARLTRGELEGEFYGTPRSMFVCATEDSWEMTIAPRLVAAGADLDRVFRVDVMERDRRTGLSLPADVDAIQQAAADYEAAILVLDPLTSRLDAKLDSHKDAEVRLALEPLAEMAERSGLLIVGIMHQSKGGKTDPIDSVMASTAFTSVARSVSIAMYDPDDDTRRRKLFGTPKNNLGDDREPTLAFTTESYLLDIPGEDKPSSIGRIVWLGETEGSISDAMERAAQDPETRTAIGDAGSWLKEYLTSCGGAADSAAIKDAGRGEGHNAKTLSRALKKLGGRAESVQNVFPRRTIWTLPIKTGQKGHISSQDTQSRHIPPSSFKDLTVLTVSTSGDSEDSGDGSEGRGNVSRQENRAPVPEIVEVPDDAPGWARDAASREAEALVADAVSQAAADAAPKVAEPVDADAQACLCGRPPTMHTRGNWTRCPRGHRYHGVGFGALDDCPACGDTP